MGGPHHEHNGNAPLAQLQYEVNLLKGFMLERLERLERLVLEQMGKQDGVEVEIAEITNDLEGMVATKADVADLKKGMAATKADVADLKKDVAEFKKDVADLKKKFNWGIGMFIISQALIWCVKVAAVLVIPVLHHWPLPMVAGMRYCRKNSNVHRQKQVSAFVAAAISSTTSQKFTDGRKCLHRLN